MAATAQSTAVDRAQVSFGTYTGDGKDTKNLYVPFIAKLVIVTNNYNGYDGLRPRGDEYWGWSFLWAYGTTKINVWATNANGNVSFKQTGNVLSWTGTNIASALNYAGLVYYYVALG